MSPRRNWESPTNSPASGCAPPGNQRVGGGTLACGWRGGGVPIPTTEEKAETTLRKGLLIVKGRHVIRQAGMMLIGHVCFRCRQQFDPSACRQAVHSHLRPWICPPPSHQTSNAFFKIPLFQIRSFLGTIKISWYFFTELDSRSLIVKKLGYLSRIYAKILYSKTACDIPKILCQHE